MDLLTVPIYIKLLCNYICKVKYINIGSVNYLLIKEMRKLFACILLQRPSK